MKVLSGHHIFGENHSIQVHFIVCGGGKRRARGSMEQREESRVQSAKVCGCMFGGLAR